MNNRKVPVSIGLLPEERLLLAACAARAGVSQSELMSSLLRAHHARVCDSALAVPVSRNEQIKEKRARLEERVLALCSTGWVCKSHIHAHTSGYPRPIDKAIASLVQQGKLIVCEDPKLVGETGHKTLVCCRRWFQDDVLGKARPEAREGCIRVLETAAFDVYATHVLEASMPEGGVKALLVASPDNIIRCAEGAVS